MLALHIPGMKCTFNVYAALKLLLSLQVAKKGCEAVRTLEQQTARRYFANRV